MSGCTHTPRPADADAVAVDQEAEPGGREPPVDAAQGQAVPQAQLGGGSMAPGQASGFVGVLGSMCMEWLVTDYACALKAIPVVRARRTRTRRSCALRHWGRLRCAVSLRRTRHAKCTRGAAQRMWHSVQHARCNMHQSACNLQHARCNIHRPACNGQSNQIMHRTGDS